MTSRRSPVSGVVLVLAGLLAVGCTTPTGALLEAFLDPVVVTGPLDAAPSPVAASPSPGDPLAVDAGTATLWPHPDGYALATPPGWSAFVVGDGLADALLGTLAGTLPGLAARVGAVLESTEAQVSMVGVDLASDAQVPPLLVVLAQSTEGHRARQVKTRAAEQIAQLPGIQGEPVRTDEQLPDAEAVRFDFVIDDPDLGQVGVQTYLFRFGGQAYLVSFVASVEVFAAAEEVFSSIAESLRFGI